MVMEVLNVNYHHHHHVGAASFDVILAWVILNTPLSLLKQALSCHRLKCHCRRRFTPFPS